MKAITTFDISKRSTATSSDRTQKARGRLEPLAEHRYREKEPVAKERPGRQNDQARLEGHYSFISAGVSPISETDRVTLTHAAADHVYFGMLGDGAKVYLIGRSGVRLDLRVHLGRNSIRTLVSGNPEVAEDVPTPLAGAIPLIP